MKGLSSKFNPLQTEAVAIWHQVSELFVTWLSILQASSNGFFDL